MTDIYLANFEATFGSKEKLIKAIEETKEEIPIIATKVWKSGNRFLIEVSDLGGKDGNYFIWYQLTPGVWLVVSTEPVIQFKPRTIENKKRK